MSHATARHARPADVNPYPQAQISRLDALEALWATLAAGLEMHAASRRQRGRGGFLRAVRTLAVRVSVTFTAAFILGALLTVLGVQLPANAATVSATPAQEAAACSAVLHFHHLNATDQGGIHASGAARAWYHAAHLAMYADPVVRADIRRYLFTGDGWSVVRIDCNHS